MKISSVNEMRNMDKQAMEKFHIPDLLLMENAGEALVSIIDKECGVSDKRFVIFCGQGNNGGDGLVAARKLYSMGGTVKVYILGDEKKYKGASTKNFEIATLLPIEIKHIESLEEIEKDIASSDIIVDAMLGTGLSRNIEGRYKDIIELINKSKKVVFSVDIPSGINGNTGKVMGIAVKANYTVTFGLPKIGNILYPGYEYCGKLYVSHISFPPSLYNSDSIMISTNDPIKIPDRPITGHKGTFGDALFIAGASGYFGAPYFSALSFLKAGGGYSRLATPKSIMPFIGNKGSEIVFIPLKETKDGSIAFENKEKILELSKKVDIVVIGPGLSLNEETEALVRELVVSIDKPLIIDGDGITAISKNSELIKKRSKGTILTPHIGEMSRLTKLSIDEIEENKIKIVQQFANELNSYIVLKGAHSLIAYPDGRIFINMSGNSGMATAGSGDVLTGTIAAMFGLGLSLPEALRMGVFIHGLAGDLAAIDMGKDGMTAQDILNHLPFALKTYRENPEEVKAQYKGYTTV